MSNKSRVYSTVQVQDRPLSLTASVTLECCRGIIRRHPSIIKKSSCCEFILLLNCSMANPLQAYLKVTNSVLSLFSDKLNTAIRTVDHLHQISNPPNILLFSQKFRPAATVFSSARTEPVTLDAFYGKDIFHLEKWQRQLLCH